MAAPGLSDAVAFAGSRARAGRDADGRSGQLHHRRIFAGASGGDGAGERRPTAGRPNGRAVPGQPQRRCRADKRGHQRRRQQLGHRRRAGAGRKRQHGRWRLDPGEDSRPSLPGRPWATGHRRYRRLRRCCGDTLGVHDGQSSGRRCDRWPRRERQYSAIRRDGRERPAGGRLRQQPPDGGAVDRRRRRRQSALARRRPHDSSDAGRAGVRHRARYWHRPRVPSGAGPGKRRPVRRDTIAAGAGPALCGSG